MLVPESFKLIKAVESILFKYTLPICNSSKVIHFFHTPYISWCLF